MSKGKLTPWFPGEWAPVRPGVYLRDIGIFKDGDYSWWDGQKWHSSWGTPAQAYGETQVSGFQCGDTPCGTVHWRGLARNPAA